MVMALVVGEESTKGLGVPPEKPLYANTGWTIEGFANRWVDQAHIQS